MSSIPIRHRCCFTYRETHIRDRREVTNETTEAVYYSGDSDFELRAKFTLLTFATPTLIAAIKIITRLFLLCSGSWLTTGKEQADRAWIRECREWHLRRSLIKASEKPSLMLYDTYKFEFTKLALGNQICKLVTLPFFLIAQTFAAVWGLIDPLDGRTLYSKLEIASSIPLPKGSHGGLVWASNYFAWCMQPAQMWEKENFYLYSSPLSCRNPFSFLAQMREDGGLDLVLSDKIPVWKEALNRLSKSPLELSPTEVGVYLSALNESASRLQRNFPGQWFVPMIYFPHNWQRETKTWSRKCLEELLSCSSSLNEAITSFQPSENIDRLRQKQACLMQVLDAMLAPTLLAQP